MIEENGNMTFLLESGKEYTSLVLKLTNHGYKWLVPPSFDTVKFPRILHADWNKTLTLYDISRNKELYEHLLRVKKIQHRERRLKKILKS